MLTKIKEERRQYVDDAIYTKMFVDNSNRIDIVPEEDIEVL